MISNNKCNLSCIYKNKNLLLNSLPLLILLDKVLNFNATLMHNI